MGRGEEGRGGEGVVKGDEEGKERPGRVDRGSEIRHLCLSKLTTDDTD